ncbi:hypothetical protein [Myceligenerans xiligouense]|uniref:hypothetical protein n=1 Tax=Myceligenerans xiligouense TaxID=253184 RepID=UPI000F506CDB|nr:hypothetical protein [Myceligenerans xiligouense]
MTYHATVETWVREYERLRRTAATAGLEPAPGSCCRGIFQLAGQVRSLSSDHVAVLDCHDFIWFSPSSVQRRSPSVR